MMDAAVFLNMLECARDGGIPLHKVDMIIEVDGFTYSVQSAEITLHRSYGLECVVERIKTGQGT